MKKVVAIALSLLAAISTPALAQVGYRISALTGPHFRQFQQHLYHSVDLRAAHPTTLSI